MSTIYAQGKYTFGEINVGLSLAASAMIPALPAINAMLYGSFGLVPMSVDLQANLNAALNVGLSWNPALTIQGALSMVAAMQANLIPALSVNVSAVADISVKLGGVKLLIDLGASIALPMTDILGKLDGCLGAKLPGVAYIAWSGTPGEMSEVSSKLQTLVAASSGQTVYCIAMAATSPAFKAAADALFKMG